MLAANPQDSTSSRDIVAVLKGYARQNATTHHEFLRYLQSGSPRKNEVTTVLQQYWYPIRHFTEFLPRVIAVTENMAMRTHVSRILWQELGEGEPSRSHEHLYLETMRSAGIPPDEIRGAQPLPETAELIAGYRRSVSMPLSAIGFLYGTEVIDLAMVSAIGAAVGNVAGMSTLPWVDVHLKQEPDHVASVNQTAAAFITEKEQGAVVEAALEVWRLWGNFYSAIQGKLQQVH